MVAEAAKDNERPMNENNLPGRVSVLEHSVERLEAATKEGFLGINKALRDMSEQMQRKGSPLPLKEIVGTFLATATVVTYILTAMNGWFDQRAAPLQLTVNRLAEQDKNGELAVLKYRVQQLEAYKLEMLKLGK